VRPLDRLPSIKLKLGVLIVVAIAVGSVVSTVGFRLGVPLLVRPLIAVVLGLVLVQVLARGMTSPLREMAAAARAMARGDYARRVTASSHDEVGELARAFNGMAAQLAEVDRLRRDLVANVSHELRTPITALRARLENLIDGVEDPDPEALRTMLAQTERLGRLVEQLLDLSRLESGAIPMDRQTFDLEDLLEQAASEARLHADGVLIDVAVGAGDAKGYGDAERLHQVVANLLANAARHSPPGGVVQLRGATAPGGGVSIIVSDEGPGIPPEERERVFERFYRGDPSRSTRDGGGGLGLSIARWVVDLHGGDIAVEDARPHGCRMVVRLPGRS